MTFMKSKEDLRIPGYEQVVYAEDADSGMAAIIAIHNMNRGPACGGVRMLPYATRDEALTDALRLAKGMSYKSALAGIGFGGGKSVIMGDPKKKTPALFEAFGELVDSLGGRYIAAKDMNISSADLLTIQRTTKHVLGIDGVPGSSGDPSPVTARGIMRALEATTEELWNKRRLDGLTLAIQGIGHVGYPVAKMAKEVGAKLIVTDTDATVLEKARRELGAQVVGLEEIYDVAADIFVPSARGAILNPTTIERLKCKAVVGCANNQLSTEADGFRLHEKGILYAPDYAVNSGGIINIFIEFDGYTQEKAFKKADEIYPTMKEIYRRAKAEKVPPFVLADKLAEERLNGK